jgi:hypothetical protein
MIAARVFLILTVISLVPGIAAAQTSTSTTRSFSEVLSFLLTNQAVQTEDFVRDAEAAAATRDTVTSLLAAELATLPPSLSSVGFTYRLNESLGTVERASASFGSFFTERSLTAGRGQGAIGVNLRFASYQRLDGRNLRDGQFLTTGNKFRDEAQPFDEERLTLDLESRVLTFTGSFGLTDRLDLSAAVPLVTLSMTGSRFNTYRGSRQPQAAADATTTGLGDVAVRAKYAVVANRSGGVAFAGELRLPTGAEENLLGAGKAAFAAVVIASTEQGRLGVEGNVSLAGGGLSNEVAYRGAVCLAATDRVTVVGEFVGRRLADVGRIVEMRGPHPSYAGVDTIRLVAEDASLSTGAFVIGAKWNVTGTWILAGHTLFPMTERGLRSGVVTRVGLDYAFDW